jgi:hypothetical protein
LVVGKALTSKAESKQPFTAYCFLLTVLMWDAKRQLIWLVAGVALGTFVAYSDAHTDDGEFSPHFFVFMESLVLGIIALLFFLYSRKKKG